MKFNTHIRQLFCVVVAMLLLQPLQAQVQPKLKKSRILFLLDASSSMTLPWVAEYKFSIDSVSKNNSTKWEPDKARFAVASNILLRIIDSVYAVNNEVEFAVRDYGTNHPAQEKNCTDTELEVPFNIQNVNQIKTRLKHIKPIGFSPIAYSLEQASKHELSNPNEYDYSIIFITDGGESCQGDICKTFNDFLAKKIKVIPYIIGLDKNESLKTYYSCLGNYVGVSSTEDIEKAIKMIVDANRILLDKPKTLNITTQFSNTPILKDTIAPKPIPVEIPIPKIELAKNELTRLSFALYAKPLQDKVKLVADKTLALRKANVNIDFTFEEEVKPLVNAKDVFPRLTMTTFVRQATQTIASKGKTLNLTKKPKLNLAFTFDVPIEKITSELARLEMLDYTLLPIKKSNLQGKSIALNKKPKLNVAFTFEEPIVKIVTELSPMKMIDYKLTSVKKAVIQGKNIDFKKDKKISLAFTFPIERDTNILPRLAMKYVAFEKPKASFNKAKPLPTKALPNKLAFAFEVVKKDSLAALFAIPFPKSFSYYATRLPNEKDKIKPFKKINLAFAFETPKPKEPSPPVNSDDLEYSIETIPSTETKVQVYFKGVNGKTYPKATPNIIINDAASKQKLGSFIRKMEGNEPVPQKIEAGKYNFVLTGFNDLYANNIVIEPNKINKVFIKVTEGTLQFSYMGNRKRQIEYKAVVNRRFAEGATITQDCNDKLYYEPGTYYVEVNTLPAAKFSVDLTFGAIYELQLPEPGFVQFLNSSALGKIQLLCVLGDQYVKFHEYSISGNVGNQLLTLQPGPYKAIIPVNPKMPLAGSKTIDFRVNSNKTTELMLE